MVHLFDEPQFNPQDGYIGFMLDFFRKLRAEGRLASSACTRPRAITSNFVRDRRALPAGLEWRRDAARDVQISDRR